MLARCVGAFLLIAIVGHANEVTKAPIDCTHRANGLYLLNANACTNEFWKCANRRTFLYKCPKPLWFNIETAACDYRHNVKACGSSVHHPISYSSYQYPSGPIVPVAVVVPQVPTTTAVPVDFDCSSKANGYYYKKPCDTAFYSCAAYIAFKFECPAGTGYDPVDRACEHLSVCGKPKPPTTTTTPAPVNVNVPDLCGTRMDGSYTQERCHSQYVLCSNGNTHLISCPAQLVYNGETCTYLQDCLNPTTTQPPVIVSNPYQTVSPPVAVEQTAYQQPSSQPPPIAVMQTTTMNYAPTTTTSAPLPPVAVEQPTAYGSAPAPVAINTPPPPSYCRDNNKGDGSYGSGCQNTFYLCSNGHTSVLECPSGLFYDVDANTCDSSRHIVACGGSKPTTVPPPVAVNPTNNPYGDVQAPINVEQPTTTQKPLFDCTNKQNGYYVVGCSSQYYSCLNGQLNSFTCPSGLNYSPEAQKCEYSANIPQCGGQLPVIEPVNVQQPSPSAVSPDAPNLNSVVEQSSTTSTEEEGTNHCENLPNGIYGRRCSRHYFVCSNYKTYEFSCPSGYAYNAKVSRCAPKTTMDACTEQQASTQPPKVQPPVNVAQPSGPYRRRRI